MAQQSKNHRSAESWGSRLGVILAVAGSAVGLGNFLRFPGQVAANGGGAFMIPYFISFLVVGIPVCWAEWSMGRYGGRYGFNSAPGIFSVLWRHPFAKYLGALGLMIPVIIYMYYVYIESWCLAYAGYYLTGDLSLGRNPGLYSAFFNRYTGMGEHGAAFKGGIQTSFWFFLAAFLLNFYFIYRGLSRGIETFCKIAMPMLILAAVIIAVRVLTLPEQPLPLSWRQSLPEVLPASEWQALRDLALNPETMPERFKSEAEKAIGKHLQAQLSLADPEPQEVAVLPPAGFAKSQAAYALEMAEMRAEAADRQIRAWIAAARAQVAPEAKSKLRDLEARELKLDGKTAASSEKLAEIDALRRALLPLLPAHDVAAVAERFQTVKGAGALGNPEHLLIRQLAIEAAEQPRTVANGLGYMWNPDFEKLKDPSVWLAAAGQIFFTLSVGFGVILTYASYLRRDDDVALSGLTASATNEFCEVCLGGLIAIPATFIFLGSAFTMEALSGSTFGLGFNTLPTVFANMQGGRWFGALWFGLLFLAAITSSLSMLQPAIAFLEEGFGLKRRVSVSALGMLTLTGAMTVIFFSKNAVVLSTMDEWIGTVGIFLLATIEIIVFAWVIGIDRGMEEANRGADLKIPRFFRFIFKYVTPLFLLAILGAWIVDTLPGKIGEIREQPEVLLTIIYLVIVFSFLALMVGLAGENWQRAGKGEHEVES
jgi:SNF family Na+-dependent transporter